MNLFDKKNNYIKKKEVVKIIENGYKQLSDAEYSVIMMQPNLIQNDREEYLRSLSEIKGAKKALKGLLKHFK